jgi:5'-methylthioadenosine phosphorylase
MKAIIGGTGVYSVDGAFKSVREVEVDTQYGSVQVTVCEVEGKGEIAFLARHGKGHSTPPHAVNYRANIMALKELGVTHILATCAVGSINRDMKPGDIVVVTDFIDFTKGRPLTFFNGEGGVKHVDMSDPYCSDLRRRFSEYAFGKGIGIAGEAIYVCTEGPRFETASEIRMYAGLGADVVGMTNVPEVVLAKEAGIHYAAVGIVTNWCTGVVEEEITVHEIVESMEKNKTILTEAFVTILGSACPDGQATCRCENSIIEV